LSTSTNPINLLGLKEFPAMNKICAFFGHRNTPISLNLEQKLEKTIRQLINDSVYEFWCCNEGTFDHLSKIIMLRIKKDYPYIHLCYISAYNPQNFPKLKKQTLEQDFEIIFPTKLTNTPPQYAIPKRNQYIVDNTDYIIAYITNTKGGAYNAIKYAQTKKKKIIFLPPSKETKINTPFF
jgi:uncharacterized phage-like protein YoqJ